MLRRIMIQKITVSMLVVILAVYGITGIGDANEVSGTPHFHDASTTRSISESAAKGANVGNRVSAHSPGTYHKYILSGTDAASFTINEDNGQIKTDTLLDYETKTSYSVTVTIQKGTLNPLSDHITGPIVNYSDADSITVTINVTDANWFFTEGTSTTRSVDENITINSTLFGTEIGSAVEAEHGSPHNYKIKQTDDWGNFWIDSSTGQLSILNSPDYETKSSYTITLQIQSGVSYAIFGITDIIWTTRDSITVTVNVNDIDESSQADALPPVTSEEAARILSLLTMDKIIFNELVNASTDAHDWVELRSVSDTDIDLDGWELFLITSDGNASIKFPAGTMLPAGAVLLFLNTDPSDPDMPLKSSDDVSYHYLIDEAFVLPQDDFMLLLRSPNTWEDTVGNYYFGHEKPETAPPLTTDVAWFRAKPSAPGSRAEAWVASGYQAGLGYDDGASEDTSLGTPGYHRQELLADANGDGVVNILDLVLVASHFGESGETGADLNSDGVVNIQDLVLVANGLGDVAAAPSARGLTAAHVEQWLRLAGQATSISQRDFLYERGIQVLEQLRQSLIPKTTTLLPNYPNPFNPETWIPYHLANASDVRITIFDVRGSVVRQLDLGHQQEGYYTSRSRAVYWDGTNELGESVASGVYFYRLQADNTSTLRKMLILK